MGFDERIAVLVERVSDPKFIESLQTEEATKLALVVPFIEALGIEEG